MSMERKKLINIFARAAAECLDKALAAYLSGSMSKDEAVDYGCKMLDEYAESEAFKAEIDDYFGNFVDIKDFDWGEKYDFIL